MEEFDDSQNQLPFCNVCLGSTDPNYQIYNLSVSGILLAFVGAVGLVGNALVILVYLSKEQRVFSTSIYLAALAMSDFCMICTAMFLFVLEAWRHHGPPMLAYLYGSGASLIFPLGAVFQTTSVYYCIGAAIDCFVSVVLPPMCKQICCVPEKAKKVVFIMTICCFFYNIPHLFELQSIPCIDERFNLESLQICPTEFRMNSLYYTIYYTYMYTTFMAVGPLLLLILLNICVVVTVLTKGADEDSDTLKNTIVYLVDLSNLLVVINCTANFFVYLIFGASFRRSLKKLWSEPEKVEKKLSNSIWTPEETESIAKIFSNGNIKHFVVHI
uniref:G-protein coupled receptors family 1 profile domain-containing protein n=1 Tax=Acrobeloides nanus TaxID=290746 RepID=A0A914DG47_9BILA